MDAIVARQDNHNKTSQTERLLYIVGCHVFCQYGASVDAYALTSNALVGLSTGATSQEKCKRLARTVLIFTESSDQLSRATDRVPGLPASPGYVQ